MTKRLKIVCGIALAMIAVFIVLLAYLVTHKEEIYENSHVYVEKEGAKKNQAIANAVIDKTLFIKLPIGICLAYYSSDILHEGSSITEVDCDKIPPDLLLTKK